MFNRLFHKDKKATAASARSLGSTTSEQLASLIPFVNAPETTNILAFNFAELVEFNTGDHLFDVGQNDEWDYFLLEGEMALVASDKRETKLESDSPKSKNPIAYLRPRKFSAEIRSKKATVVRLPHHVLELAFKQASGNSSWGQEELVVIGELDQESLLDKITQEIGNGTLTLPSLPEVAERVRQACQDSENSTAAITKIIASDTAISAKLLAASNSPLYRGANPTKTLQDAIARLGRNTTQQLVYYYATRELFDTPMPSLRELFTRAWQQSLERGAMAQTLARYGSGRLNPDVAFLCGLLFRVGDIVAYQYAAEAEVDADEMEKIQQIADSISVQISRKLIQDWNMPSEVLEALEYGADWSYCAGGESPDYGELMVVTNVHVRMLHNRMRGLPELTNIPAITRMITDDFAPDVSIITQAKKALAELTEL
ncbi:HDOD domain-containing protein [Halioxenophilus aromaticivorans]|uniref:HDOD domain-containing protein n=1 Tax=Halioxenophilus aromaticivorans TaxID=1306992 RepID=A0AAV3TYU5_9ALTE